MQNKQKLIIGIALVGLATGLILTREAALSLPLAFFGTATIILGISPSILYLLRMPASTYSFPLLPLTGLYYALFYGVPIFLIRFIPDTELGSVGIHKSVSTGLIQDVTLAYVVGGLILVYATYYCTGVATRRLKFQVRFPHLKSQSLTLKFILLLLLAHLLYINSTALQSLPSIGLFLGPVGLFCYGTIFLLWLQKEIGSATTLAIFAIALPITLVDYFSSGLLTPIIEMFVLALVLFHAARRRIPWTPIAVAFAIFLFLYPLTPTIRLMIANLPAVGEVWSSPESENSKLQRTVKFLGVVVQSLSLTESQVKGARPVFDPAPFYGLIQRVDSTTVLDRVVRMTPNEVPHWYGETYKPLLTSLIPRAIWPEKPEERFGNKFAKRYKWIQESPSLEGIRLYVDTLSIPESDKTAEAERHYTSAKERLDKISLNLPWIVEMFANFGALGVAIGMSLIGILFKLLETIFCRSTSEPISFVAGAVILTPLFYQASNLSVTIGATVPYLICLYLYFLIGTKTQLRRR